MNSLFKQLITLEMQLHQLKYRKESCFLEKILHHDFLEFCRSGITTDKVDTLASLPQETEKSIYSENYQCTLLAENTVLLTYLSYELADNKRIKETHRSSIWLKNNAERWQLRFHQGTPC